MKRKNYLKNIVSKIIIYIEKKLPPLGVLNNEYINTYIYLSIRITKIDWYSFISRIEIIDITQLYLITNI